ncbi:unnamed protein product [Durusdinium trenchii]|uniref:Uncharacterized protein n=1 Tax=Durusdinium trenchii TaxID=1381693 RepID=A0ABP0MZA2_9DINO
MWRRASVSKLPQPLRSCRRAFALRILSKNILGTFYLPQLVFCISETFLTLSKCSVHAAVGEACKTMGMLGIANSSTGQKDWHNILGGVEFASDFTKIIETVGGFEELIRFLQATRELKAKALALGEAGWRAESVAREERVVEGGGGVVERMTEVE